MSSPNAGISFDIEWDLERLTDRNIRLMPKIERVLSRFNILATFFVVGKVILMHKRLFQDLQSVGHEIGCHGYFHHKGSVRELYDSADYNFMRQNIDLAYNAVSGVTGRPPKGFRAPYLRIGSNTYPLLEQAGFLYSSSVCKPLPPTSLTYLKQLFSPSTPFLPKSGLKIREIPIPAKQNGLYLRLSGRPACANYDNNVYLYHSWEFDQQETGPFFWRYGTGDKFTSLFEQQLQLLADSGVIFKKLEDF